MQDTLFERSIRAFREDHRSARERLASLQRAGRMLSVVLFALILGYFATLAYSLSVNLAPERFEAPLEAEAHRLLPMLEPELRALWEETAAAYADPRLRDAVPQLTISAGREFELMQAGLAASADRQLRLVLQRLATSPPEALTARVMQRGGESAVRRLEAGWPRQATELLAPVAPGFAEQYAGDLRQLRLAMIDFEGSAYAYMDEERLAQQLIRLWLTKVDRQQPAGP